MRGKTFFVLLSGLDTPDLTPGLLPPPLFVVIERACAPDKARRYPSLSALRQSLTLAFSVILGRANGSGGVLGTQQAIIDRWQSTNQTDLLELGQFIDELAMLSPSERHRPLVVSCGNQRRQSVVVVAPCGHVGKSQSGLSTCPCGLVVHELEAVS